MRRVLIVPNSLLVDELGPTFLERAQVKVRAARNATEALAMAVVWQPDLILFSNTLRDATVAELVSRVREGLGDTKLFLLADTLGGDEDPAAVDAQLVTPVDPETVLATLYAVLDLKVHSDERVATLLLGRLEGGTEDPDLPGTLVNILDLSSAGLIVESPCLLRPGADARIRFELPDGTRELSFPAHVQALIDEIQLRYQIAFEASDADRAAIEAFIATRRRDG